MRTLKQLIKDWLDISKLEAAGTIEALLDQAEAAETEPTIKKGYDARL